MKFKFFKRHLKLTPGVNKYFPQNIQTNLFQLVKRCLLFRLIWFLWWRRDRQWPKQTAESRPVHTSSHQFRRLTNFCPKLGDCFTILKQHSYKQTLYGYMNWIGIVHFDVISSTQVSAQKARMIESDLSGLRHRPLVYTEPGTHSSLYIGTHSSLYW